MSATSAARDDKTPALTTALQKIGRNVVNLQKMEAMLRYLLGISEIGAPEATESMQ